ncbi:MULTISPECIES: flagellar basal body P-ring formation chaperone FlgA [Photorhabdus]|uniref:Flagella basal body P-ring formation protein FlgA n=1 Tax=Photorhabdus thracensis TaxID=230089 RepID=A0A0F7LQN0_9GAMM|nr:flagellar basal body P-ring formation chaperone FlgA [Photorhabdus thracensis]AKH65549.1 flagellar basal body P-ring biosynthesis protein FlgA [Photorhabdus thracensis]MCC8421688.1 flagellar basal body P-ring formation protein FlgA [Photorhabdus thracensis]
MQAIKIIGLFAFFFMTPMVWGNNLPQTITHYFQQIHRDNHQKISVEIRTPEQQWPQCESPEIHPAVGGQNWGNISLPIVCHQKRKFIQVAVSVTGHYWVTRRALSRNDVLSEKDFQIRSGLLEKLPSDLIVNKNEIKNSVAIRNIPAGQAITRNMLRRPWAVRAGQNVGVIVQGKGFQIRNEGKAINNAATSDKVRVRMNSGHVITGQALENGSVKIML